MDHEPSHHRPDAGPSSDHLIAGRLSTEARRIDIGSPMLDVVVHRGRQRQQRRRTAVGVMAVVGVCAGTIVGINELSQPSDRSISSVVGDGDGTPTGADSTTGTGPGSPIHLVDSTLVWTTVEPGTAQALSVFSGFPGRKVAGDGPFIAWSTTPGVNTEVAPALWRSDDGISWTQVADVPSMTAATIADRDGRFFAYGTAPAGAAVDGRTFDMAMSTSDDGGLTWNEIALPLDTADLADEPGVTGVSVSPVAIAAGPTGVLAAARVTASIDWESLLPDGVWSTGNWEMTADGVEIHAATPCGATSDTAAAVPTATALCDATATTIVVGVSATSTTTVGAVTADSVPMGVGDDSVPVNASTVPAGAQTTAPPRAASTLTWAELGVSEKAASYARGLPQLFFSADGVTFTAIANASSLGDDWQNVQLTDVDDGFVASVVDYDDSNGTGTSMLFHTVDGSSWTELGPSPLTYADTFDSFDGRLVMSGQVQTSPMQQASMVAIRNGDGSWSTVLLDDLSSPSDGVKTSFANTALAVGPTGISVVATQYVDAVAQAGGAELSRNGITMRAEDGNGEFSFIDESTGNTLASTTGRVPSTELVSLDPNTGGYDVRLETEGEVMATFTADEMFNRMNEITVDGPPPSTSVFHSTDGIGWSRESLNELAAQQLGSAGVRLTDTQILVAATVAGQTAADGTPKQIILVGTPKG